MSESPYKTEFYRKHQHTPDGYCSDILKCEYRPTKIPINSANLDPIHLASDPGFAEEKRTIEELQRKWKKMVHED